MIENFTVWAITTPWMIWLYVALLGLALILLVRRTGERIDLEKSVTLAGALNAIIRACAHGDPVTGTAQAAWALSRVRGGLDGAKVTALLNAAILIHQRRREPAAFDMGDETTRAVAQYAANWPQEGNDLLAYISSGDNVDPEQVDALASELSDQALAAMQLRFECAIVDHYREALTTERGVDSLYRRTYRDSWDAISVSSSRAWRWASARWGRGFCFAVGGMMALSAGSGSTAQAVGGGVLLATGLGLSALAVAKAKTQS